MYYRYLQIYLERDFQPALLRAYRSIIGYVPPPPPRSDGSVSRAAQGKARARAETVRAMVCSGLSVGDRKHLVEHVAPSRNAYMECTP